MDVPQAVQLVGRQCSYVEVLQIACSRCRSHINSASVQVAGHRTEYARVSYGTNVVTDHPNKDNMGRVIDINVGTVVARFSRLGFCVTILVMICHANYAHSHCWLCGEKFS